MKSSLKLFNQYRSAILRTVNAIRPPYIELDDILQDVYLHIDNKSHLIEGLSSSQVGLYIKKMARTVIIRHLKKIRHTYGLSIELEDRRSNSGFSLETQEALALINPPFRKCAYLFYIEGLTGPEIADRLNIPEGTVKSRLHTARKKLRIALDPS